MVLRRHVQAGSLTVTVKQRNDKPLVGAVITLESAGLAASIAGRRHHGPGESRLRSGRAGDPAALEGAVSQQRCVSHQVYSFSSARQFQLPLYRGKAYPPVVFDQPGVVTLGCNIHDNMLAYIVVTAAPYFGRTGADGEWTAPNLPPGKYSLRVWHPLLNEPQEVRAHGADGR